MEASVLTAEHCTIIYHTKLRQSENVSHTYSPNSPGSNLVDYAIGDSAGASLECQEV